MNDKDHYEQVNQADIAEAERHTDWFLSMIRPLLISWMIHGKKHGREEARQRRATVSREAEEEGAATNSYPRRSVKGGTR